MKYENIIFDLDGTLIDSAPAILSSLCSAFDEVGVVPARELVQSLVGPPLREIIEDLLDASQICYVDALEYHFKRIYDSEGYKNTQIYNGVGDLLNMLRKSGRILHIATNKRIAPTLSLIEMLNWDSLFHSIYSADTFTKVILNKDMLINKMLIEQVIDVSKACYIGDRNEDGLAAQANSLDFVMVKWGYDAFTGGYASASSPDELLKHLLRG